MDRHERAVAMLSWDPRLVSLARYCSTFHLDIVEVARTDTESNRWIRYAALRVIGRDQEEEQSRSKGKRG